MKLLLLPVLAASLIAPAHASVSEHIVFTIVANIAESCVNAHPKATTCAICVLVGGSIVYVLHKSKLELQKAETQLVVEKQLTEETKNTSLRTTEA